MNPENEMNDGEEQFDADLTGAGGDRYLFPDGDYPLRLMDVAKDTSKSSGKPMYVWTFVGGPELRNTTFKMYTSLSPEASWKLAEVVLAFGIGKSGEKVSFKKKDVIGKVVLGKLEKGQYDGKSRSELRSVAAYNGPSVSASADNIPF